MMSESRETSFIHHWLKKHHSFWLVLYAAMTAFCLYTCVYGLRKAFSVASFDALQFLGVSYKVWLVTFQVSGYALSKFLGIRIISELKSASRFQSTLLLSAIAWLSWLFFALIPAPYNIVFLFTNGLPLGLIWGILFSYLEGRRFTEVLGAGLSASFIFSSGFARSVGSSLIQDVGVAENWMPFVAGSLFMVPLIPFAWMLDQVPPPSRQDEKLRTRRKPMKLQDRIRFLTMFGPAIILFVACYVLLTCFRDFRDNFFVELLRDMRQVASPQLFSSTEIPITILVLVGISSIMTIRGNFKALMVIHWVIITGLLITGLSTFAFQMHLLTPIQWISLIGLGLYMSYVPFNSVFFERMLAAFRYPGTVGFIMYFADSLGYLGSVGVLFLKEFVHTQIGWLSFFMEGSYLLSITGVLLMVGSMIYFKYKHRSYRRSSDDTYYKPKIALRSGI
ncbi:MAG: DUF5690 family protein [Cyclobacteriaceae bacterium]